MVPLNEEYLRAMQLPAIELVEERRRRGASAARLVKAALLICVAPTVGSGRYTVLVPDYLLNTAF